MLKAPEPTALKKASHVRFASDDSALAGTTRWEFGVVTKVHKGGELIDVDFQNGEQLRGMPTFDVLPLM